MTVTAEKKGQAFFQSDRQRSKYTKGPVVEGGRECVVKRVHTLSSRATAGFAEISQRIQNMEGQETNQRTWVFRGLWDF